MHSEEPVVLFDGVCNVCNTAVNFVLDHERASELRFASLQSSAARSIATAHGLAEVTGDPDSIVFVEGGRVFEQSSAALRIARYLRWPYRAPRRVRRRSATVCAIWSTDGSRGIATRGSASAKPAEFQRLRFAHGFWSRYKGDLVSARSENPFSRAFWIGSVDPRPLALVRIALGLAVLHDLANLTRDFRAFLTDDGFLPRGSFHESYTWGLFDLVGSPFAAGVLYAVGVLAVVAFTVGYQTRVATFATWLFLASIHHRNYFVTDGGDELVRILVFWGLFSDWGAAYSLDARRRASRVVDVPAFGLRLLQLQIAVLYFCAARLKFRLGWLHGDSIFYALQLEGFARPPGALLERYPALCNVATKAILAMEGLFAFAAFSPFAVRASRAIAIALGLAVQLGILVTMRVGIFTEVMLAVMLLFVLPEWIDRAEAFARSKGWLAEDRRPTSTIEAPRWRHVVNGVVLLQFVLAIWGMFAARRFPLPQAIRDEIKFVDVEAKYGLFDTTYDIPHWQAPGVLADGTAVEVLSVAAPGAMPRGPAWTFSRWNKFTFKEREHPFLFAELGAYLCREYDEERPGAKLATFTLIDDATPPRPPNGPAQPPNPRVLWSETCP